jgi:hypothetical protein
MDTTDAAIDADWVRARLEEAGATLFCLPSRGVWPAGYRTAWPAMAELIEEKGWGDVVLRLDPPTAAQIDRMDEVDEWISTLVPDVLERRVLRARSFVNPRTGAPVLSWRQLGVLTHRDHKGLMRLFDRALAKLAAALGGDVPKVPTARAILDQDATPRRGSGLSLETAGVTECDM